MGEAGEQAEHRSLQDGHSTLTLNGSLSQVCQNSQDVGQMSRADKITHAGEETDMASQPVIQRMPATPAP